MDNLKQNAPVAEEEAKITLGLLSAIEANSAVTQRSVAGELGIALGLANAYLKRCVRTGLIKVQQVPANRYAYYLTPKGFAEKSRLTAEYLSISFNFFRNARSECSAVFDECVARGLRRIALAGIGDLGEIATLCASDSLVNLVGFYDPDTNGDRFAGLTVADRLETLPEFDAVVVTNFRRPQETFDQLVTQVSPDRVFAPGLLGISRERPHMME